MMNSFQVVLDYLGIKTQLLLSSSLNKDNNLRGKDKVKSICRLLDADTYYNAIGGQELYEKDDFKNSGIELFFLKSEISQYTQFNNEFLSGLSMIDILMFNSPKEINNMLNEYQLV